MSKTLRIISVITAIFIVAMVVLPAFSGAKVDERMQQMLNGPSVMEISRKNLSSSKDDQEDSPLVQQAQIFALFLNPPAPVSPPPSQRQQSNVSPRDVRPPAPVEAKFDLVATSFFAAKPKLSLALIDEPGKGLSWVRPESQVGHLIIEEIRDGVIVIRDGNRTYELTTQRPPRISLIKGENNNFQQPPTAVGISSAPAAPASVYLPGSTRRSATSKAKITSKSNTNTTSTIRPSAIPQNVQQQPEIDPEEIARWEKFMENSQNLSEEEWLKKAEEMLSQDSEERISQDEAEQLDQMGQGLSENDDD